MDVIGRKPVLELLKSERPVQRVAVAIGTRGEIIGDILREAKRRGIRIDRIPQDRVKRVFPTGNHQGVLAETSPFKIRSLAELESGSLPVRHGLLVALDGVTDPYHLGAIARSAAAAGCDGLIQPQRRSAPLGDTAVKASAGMLLRLSVIGVKNLADALLALKKQGWWIYGTAMDGDGGLWDHEWPERSVIVFGSEGKGISHRVAQSCDAKLSIPMQPGVESLSVSAAAAVILFDRLRKAQVDNIL